MPGPLTDSSTSNRREWFVTTHWSVVLAARRRDSTRGRVALEKLCQTYWYPLYVFARRFGHGPHDAEDLVQGFFEKSLEKDYFSVADESKGRFRSFLLLALKRFIANEWDKSRAHKRGGTRVLLSLDALSSEKRYALEPANSLSADKLFERRWALTLLETVIERLRQEQAAAGRSTEFEQLKDCLTAGGASRCYADLAATIGMSEGAVKVAVHRLRRRYRELLEEEIAHTVSSPEEIAEERRYLLRALNL